MLCKPCHRQWIPDGTQHYQGQRFTADVWFSPDSSASLTCISVSYMNANIRRENCRDRLNHSRRSTGTSLFCWEYRAFRSLSLIPLIRAVIFRIIFAWTVTFKKRVRFLAIGYLRNWCSIQVRAYPSVRVLHTKCFISPNLTGGGEAAGNCKLEWTRVTRLWDAMELLNMTFDLWQKYTVTLIW